MERYKARLGVNCFTQKEDINFKETFSPIYMKDAFRTIMTPVTHFDFELHQRIYKLKKSIYKIK